MEHHARDSGFRGRYGGEERELFTIENSPPFDRYGRQDRELSRNGAAGRYRVVRVRGLQRRALEPAKGRPQLIVRPSVDATTDGSKEAVQRERYCTVAGMIGVVET